MGKRTKFYFPDFAYLLESILEYISSFQITFYFVWRLKKWLNMRKYGLLLSVKCFGADLLIILNKGVSVFKEVS